MSERMGKIVDVLAEKAKEDLILIPRNCRIGIDIVMGLAWFAGVVVYPVIRCTVSDVWNWEFVLFVCFGAFISGLFFFFAFKANKAKRPEMREHEDPRDN